MTRSDSLSPERIHRLRPSDIQFISNAVKTDDGIRGVLKEVYSYFVEIENPLASELDDISRVCLQLRMTGLWNTVRPQVLIWSMRDIADKKVTATIQNALHVSANLVNQSTVAIGGTDANLLAVIRENHLLNESLATRSLRINAAALADAATSSGGISPTTSGKFVVKGIREVRTGVVKWFNPTKGFGFIQPDDGGKDVFVHVSAIERSGIGNPHEGQKITYELESDRQGKASATDLKLL